MVNLNWPETKRTEANNETERMVSKETNERPKATISAGMVLCSKCKCEAELEVVLNRQSQPMPSVFDGIGTSSRDKTRQGKVSRTSPKTTRRMTEQPKKEISIKMPGNDKPLAAIIEGRWYLREDWIEENEEEQLDYEPSTMTRMHSLEWKDGKTGRRIWGGTDGV
ncbi:unnamed protein product [Prunus brigantina]